MRSQIFAVFLIGLVATHALPVPEEAVSEMSNPRADIEAPESLEAKSIAQEEPVDLEPKADMEAAESLEAKSNAKDEPVDLEPKADIEAPESLEAKSIEQEREAVLPIDTSLEPIAEQMRSAISSANDVINDMTAEVKDAAVRALDYAKELTAPMTDVEKANVATSLADRAMDVYGKVQADAKNLLDRTLQNTDSVRLSGRSALFSSGDLVKVLQNKYLTSDGQDLVKAVLSFSNI